MSEIRIAWSSLMLLGSLTSPTLAKGTRTFSACMPLNGPVLCGPPKKAVPAAQPSGLATSHWEGYPARHYRHLPHGTVEAIATRPRSCRFHPCAHTDSTVPAPHLPETA